jgi:general secretion pathway protein B
MSYILDALKRAERERKRGTVSMLDEMPHLAPPPKPRGSGLRDLLIVAVLVAALAIAVFAGLRWHRHAVPVLAPAPPAASAPPVAMPAPPQPAMLPPPPAPSPSPPAQATLPPPPPPPQNNSARIEDAQQIATLDDVTRQPPGRPQVRHMTPRGLPPMGPPGARPEPWQQEDGAPPQPGADQGPPPEANQPPPGDNPPGPEPQQPPVAARAAPSPPPVEAPESQSTPETAAIERPAPASIPSPPIATGPLTTQGLKEMPDTYRANFPQFNVDVFAYNADAKRSFVLIDGKRYTEGNVIAQGPQIVHIVPDGIVFDWQGQRVLYPTRR